MRLWLFVCGSLLVLSACTQGVETRLPTPPPAPTLSLQQVANTLFHATELTPSRIYQKGSWVLFIYYRAKGSRSEGQHGVLTRDGKEVIPGQVAEVLQTDLGQMKYYKYPEEMKQSWETTGWNFSDTTLIKKWDDK